MNKKIFLLLVSLSGVWATLQADKFYFCDFENPAPWEQWTFKNSRNAPNTEWGIGTAQRTYGERALYVSTDQGTTAGYEAGQYGIVAYTKLSLEKGVYRISFDWKALGVPNVDQMWVSLVPLADSTGIFASEVGSDIPRALKENLITSRSFSGKEKQWITEYHDYTLYEDGAFLCFYWQANGVPPAKNPAGCVDNIQIVPKENIYHEPIDIFPRNTADGFTFSWNGDAANYEVLVYDVGKTASSNFEVMNVNGTSVTMPYALIQEGAYRFRVRPIDENGNPGLWAETRVVMVYDPVSRCFDYMNFYLPEVECTYGSALKEDIVKQVLDSGYTEMGSFHTIHYMGETDPRTYTQTRALSTLPKGENLASVRLGGRWYKGGGDVAQSITYTVPIDETMGVIEFKYAVVAQSGGHGEVDQPHFTLQILDENGNPITGQQTKCLTADFRPPRDEEHWKSLGGEKSGWYLADPERTNFSAVYWRDWTLVAFNVQDYVGKVIKIRIVNRACTQGDHWSYIYFTLGCSDGKLKRAGCDDPNNQYLVAPEGFSYEWTKPYNMSEPFYKGQDTKAQKLYVRPDDPNVYECLVFNKETGCGFTLEASGTFRLPRAEAEWKVTPVDCKNTVTFKSKSAIYTTYTDDYGQVIENTTDDPVNLAWQFGENGMYGVSTSDSLMVEFPAEGGTFPVTLVAIMPDSESECTNVYQFNVTVPPLDVLKMNIGDVEKDICDVNNLHFNIPYVNEGTAKTVDVNLFDEKDGAAATFVGPQGLTLDKQGVIRVDVPQNAEKKMYRVDVVFHGNCTDSTMTTQFGYFPADVIAHRWDDVLAVRRPEYISAVKDGGEDPAEYEYTEYQWYKNGQPMPGETNSFIYVQEKLDMSAVYEVELTRKADGVKIISCPANLGAISDADKSRQVELANTYVQAGASAQVLTQGAAPMYAEVRVLNMLGVELSSAVLNGPTIQVDMPRSAGIYVVEVILHQIDGTILRNVERVVVR